MSTLEWMLAVYTPFYFMSRLCMRRVPITTCSSIQSLLSIVLSALVCYMYISWFMTAQVVRTVAIKIIRLTHMAIWLNLYSGGTSPRQLLASVAIEV